MTRDYKNTVLIINDDSFTTTLWQDMTQEQRMLARAIYHVLAEGHADYLNHVSVSHEGKTLHAPKTGIDFFIGFHEYGLGSPDFDGRPAKKADATPRYYVHARLIVGESRVYLCDVDASGTDLTQALGDILRELRSINTYDLEKVLINAMRSGRAYQSDAAVVKNRAAAEASQA